MTSRLGCHWIRTHPDGRDLDHIGKMQYKSVKLFEWSWSDKNFCHDLLAVLPQDAYILARDHPLSEQKQDLWNDPAATGARHANEWAMKVAMGQYHLPVERTFFLGINEPDATSGDRNAIDIYTSAFLARLRVHGLRGGAFNFSTGHPRTVDGTGGTPADYTVFERSHQAIVECHGIGVLHIYGTAATPCAPGHYDRLKACAWQDVTWVVGEMGADEHVVGGGQHDGYLISMAGHVHDYAAWLDTLILGINDSRIHSYQVFTYDFSHPWSSFDVREIRDTLESYTWQHMQHQPLTNTPTTTPAAPTPTGPVAVVNVPNGANIRSGPGREYPVLGAEAYGIQMPIAGRAVEYGHSRWWLVEMEHIRGWVSNGVVDARNVDNVPVVDVQEPTPAPSDNWQRSRAFVRKWEGDYSDNPEDHGNWTGGRKGQGELKGTKYGISAASYPLLDIRSLTMDEADAIYFRDYWQASNAASLPWPYCLIVFDAAVLHGVGTSLTWQQEAGNHPFAFAAKRLRTYTKLDNWNVFGKGWVSRIADLLLEASKA